MAQEIGDLRPMVFFDSAGFKSGLVNQLIAAAVGLRHDSLGHFVAPAQLLHKAAAFFVYDDGVAVQPGVVKVKERPA